VTEAVQQEQAPQQQQTEQPAPAAPQQPLTDEQIMARVLQGERPRDAQGRFTAQQQQAPAEQQQQAQQPAAEPTQEQQSAEQAQEYKWDDLKNIKVKIPMKNGDKEWTDELTLDEMRNQRMMHSDYMARRREFDNQIKEREAKAQQAVETERKNYLSTLQTLHQAIMKAAAPELSTVDWNKLAAENPAEYVRLANRAREVNAALESVRFEQEKVKRQQAEDDDKRQRSAIAESKQKLLEAIPTWNEDVYQSLMKRGVDTYGFAPDDIGKVWDHRIMQMLHDAHQFRLLKEKKPATDATVENLPPVLKPGPQKPKVSQQEQELRSATEALRRNPNDMDAGAALMATFLRPKTQGR